MIYSLKKIRKSYHPNFVLKIDHLDIKKGEVYALLGPNGAGKTTLLNIMSFLDSPDSGEVRYRDNRIQYTRQKLLSHRREVTLIDQKPILFSTSVYKNLEFGLKLRNIPKYECQQRIEKALDLVNLGSKIMYQAHKLSGGEAQRVAIARAIVLNPEVILCDEPLANVDFENRTSIINLFKDLNRKRGTTLMFSTHDQLQAASLTNQWIHLEDGRLVKNVFENKFYANIIHQNGQAQCTLNRNLLFNLPPTDFVGPVIMMIDPREIKVTNLTNDQLENRFTGKILQITDEEKEIRLIIDIGIQLTVLISPYLYQEKGQPVGSTIDIQIQPQGIHFSN
ncbi:MAG: ATP-binding cassette domain-containing protein [Proteobacteria bacterium]|nr:ATP-binding cassette domain-containing protein [Pseudomonadota bacterium]